MREGEECRGRSVGRARDEGGEGVETKAAYAEVHEVACCEHGEDVTPAKVAVFAGEEVDDDEGVVLGSQGGRFRGPAHESAPVFGWQFFQGFCKGFVASVKFCTGVGAVDHIARDEEVIEVAGCEQGEEYNGYPGAR